MLLFAGVMMAMGAVSRRADEIDSRRLPVEDAQRLDSPVLGGEAGIHVPARPVLQACRDCLSVVAGGYDTCPACGGALAPTHPLESPERKRASEQAPAQRLSR